MSSADPPLLSQGASKPVDSDASAVRMYPRWSVRVWGLLGFLLATELTLNVLTMMILRGRDPVTGMDDESYSPTMIVFFVICLLSWFVAVWDVIETFRGTGRQVAVLTWKWQHNSFLRSVVPLVVHTLLLFPIFLTFIFQSRGGSFFGDKNDLDSDFQRDINFHIATFCLIAGTAIFQQIVVRYILKLGLFDHGSTPGTVMSRFRKHKKSRQHHQRAASDAGAAGGSAPATSASATTTVTTATTAGGNVPVTEVDLMIEEELYPQLRADIHDAPWTRDLYVQKLMALMCMGASVLFCVSLVKGDIREANSGVIIFTIIYFLMAFVVMFYNIVLLMRAKHYKEWWLAYRAVAGLHLFVAYICFWLTLFLVVLVGHENVGFWNAVSELTSKRSSIVYVHIAMYFCLLFVVAIRIYYSKLRKKHRQPRVLEAVAATEADNTKLAQRETQEIQHRKDLMEIVVQHHQSVAKKSVGNKDDAKRAERSGSNEQKGDLQMVSH